MHQESIHRLAAAGFHYKPPESPEIWAHLESHFVDPSPLGPRFDRFPASRMAEMIARGEEALLESLMNQLRRDGKPSRIVETLAMPYIVGTCGALPRDEADPSRLLKLIEHPGTAREHIIHLMPTEPDAIPGTPYMTVTGGIYADGHTAGYYDLCPGRPFKPETCVYLAADDDIRGLAAEMRARIEDINIAPADACESMLAAVERLLA